MLQHDKAKSELVLPFKIQVNSSPEVVQYVSLGNIWCPATLDWLCWKEERTSGINVHNYLYVLVFKKQQPDHFLT